MDVNVTLVTEFYLVAFGDLRDFKVPCFSIFLIVYVGELLSNVLVIVLVATSQNLHFPVYFFLSQLSLSELLFTPNILPTILWLILYPCLGASPNCTCSGLQKHLVLACWLSSFLFTFLVCVLLFNLEFCHYNVIDHFYCDIDPIMRLSCSDTSFLKLIVSLLSAPVVLFPFIFIMVTYVSIILTILRISSTCRRQKAFSTCSSHLMVVCLYYGTLTTLYIVPPGEHSGSANKGLAVLYTSVTPLFNPIVYTLRNQDIKKAIRAFILL
ncbi:hypothetical protein GDO86_018702 [Hymenochirus boettgeri]|uniref:G-protein coupled receptors family 1 profile domain-containing protein n=1 Tax=Hymenochirus boettgeri TaxID=247094 RepID=A0A8T2IE59_9PIPI|nr:hypothetical protein GDO86_018702 [Hymenochirus boettgeri]